MPSTSHTITEAESTERSSDDFSIHKKIKLKKEDGMRVKEYIF